MEDYLCQVKRRENKKKGRFLAALEVVLNNRVFKIGLPLSGIQNPSGKTDPAGISASNKKNEGQGNTKRLQYRHLLPSVYEGASIS